MFPNSKTQILLRSELLVDYSTNGPEDFSLMTFEVGMEEEEEEHYSEMEEEYSEEEVLNVFLIFFGGGNTRKL